MFINLNKKVILRNCLLLSTVCAGLIFSGEAKAELIAHYYTGYSAANEAITAGKGAHTYGYQSVNIAETNKINTFTAQQTFSELTFSTEGSAIVNTIATSISSSSTDNELITAKGVYDYLDNAGIADMSVYAKTADVYTKDEVDDKFLTTHQDISGKANVGDSYTKAESDAKYLTSHQDISGKANIADVYTKSEVYTKDEADGKFLTSHQDISGKANVGDSYTKEESDAKYLTSHQDISGKANVGDSYTKDESDAKYLTSHQDISGKANVGDSYTKEESDAKYLTSHQDISGKANVADVYAKSEVYTKDEADGILCGS